MSAIESCVVILKPKLYFLNLVASYCHDLDFPSLEKLQDDCTAYCIKNYVDDESLFIELQRLFSVMFLHEVDRLLGEDLAKNIKIDFIDFLCCFKFEVHPRLVLVEDTLEDCKQIIRFKPKVINMPMVSSCEVSSTTEHDDHVVPFSDECHETLVLIKQMKGLVDNHKLLQTYYRPIVEAQANQQKRIPWPTMDNYEKLSDYFSAELLCSLVHLH